MRSTDDLQRLVKNLQKIEYVIDEHVIIEYYDHMEAFKLACEQGDLGTVQSLYPHLVKPVDMEDIIIDVCVSGDLEMLQYLISKSPDMQTHPDGVFVTLCEFGHLQAAQWLTNTYHEFDYSLCVMDALLNACGNGDIDVVKWLLYTFPNIDMRDDNYHAFTVCDSLDLVQWFLQTYPSINPHVHNDSLFINACRRDRVDIVRWLYENIGIDIHMHNEQCFRMINHDSAVANFFVEITEYSNDFYYIGDRASYIITKNTIPGLFGTHYESYNIYSIDDVLFTEAIVEIDRRFAVSRKKSAQKLNM